MVASVVAPMSVPLITAPGLQECLLDTMKRGIWLYDEKGWPVGKLLANGQRFIPLAALRAHGFHPPGRLEVTGFAVRRR